MRVVTYWMRNKKEGEVEDALKVSSCGDFIGNDNTL